MKATKATFNGSRASRMVRESKHQCASCGRPLRSHQTRYCSDLCMRESERAWSDYDVRRRAR